MPPAFFGFIGSLGGALGSTTAAWAVTAGTIIVGSAASIGLGYLARLFIHPPDLSFGEQRRKLSDLTQDSDAPRVMAFGDVVLQGAIRFRNDREAGAAGWLDEVLTLTGHEISEFLETQMDVGNGFEALPLDGAGEPEMGNKYRDYLKLAFKKGAAGEAAFADLITNSNGLWTPSHRQDGCASVYVQINYQAVVADEALFPNVPVFRFRVLGMPVYDPRDETIHYDHDSVCNPALWIVTYLPLKKAWGAPAIPLDEIRADAAIAAANICDEEVDIFGGTQPRYSGGIAFPFGRGCKTDLDEMLSAMAGWMTTTAPYGIFAGVWSGSVLELDDDDLAGPIQYQALASVRGKANTVKGTYVSPENNWEIADYPPYRNVEHISDDDGVVLLDDMPLPGTIDQYTAQRLAKIREEESRRQGVLTARWKPVAAYALAGEVVGITHQQFVDAGLWPAGKTFRVMTTSDIYEVPEGAPEGSPPAHMVEMTLQEADADIYAAIPAGADATYEGQDVKIIERFDADSFTYSDEVDTHSVASVVNTTIAAGVASGEQEVTPGSMTGIRLNAVLVIDEGNPGAEFVIVSAVTGSTFTAEFGSTHSGGVTVKNSVLVVAPEMVEWPFTISKSGSIDVHTPGGALGAYGGDDVFAFDLYIESDIVLRGVSLLLRSPDSTVSNYFFASHIDLVSGLPDIVAGDWNRIVFRRSEFIYFNSPAWANITGWSVILYLSNPTNSNKTAKLDNLILLPA